MEIYKNKEENIPQEIIKKDFDPDGIEIVIPTDAIKTTSSKAKAFREVHNMNNKKYKRDSTFESMEHSNNPGLDYELLEEAGPVLDFDESIIEELMEVTMKTTDIQSELYNLITKDTKIHKK